MSRPVCYVLIGPPGCGKTTWRNNHARDLYAISSDDYIEEIARHRGETYSEVFRSAIGDAREHVYKSALHAANNNLDVVWDQTNVTKRSREKIFATLPCHKKIAVLFDFSDRTELNKRLANRPGKHIPSKAVDYMIKKFQMPCHEEGFESIILVDDK